RHAAARGDRRRMLRVAVVGPGAIGSVVAVTLAQHPGLEVTVCARRPLSSLTVETPTRRLHVQPRVLTQPAEATPVDWVLVATKAYDAAGAGEWIRRLAAQGAPIAVLQNGVEHRERFAPYAPAAQIVPVIVDLPAERAADGSVRQRGRGLMTVAADDHGRAFAQFFGGSEIEVVCSPDLHTAAWRKLCLNSAGVISALLLQPAGVMRDEAIRAAAAEIVRECIAVGRAEGARLDDAIVDTVLDGYARAPVDAVNSLHADCAAGRPAEIDARNGVIVRLGRKHGIPTPCNQLAVALLEAQRAPRVPTTT
ncbi:MAG TPA: 2-dehydropantoate 2-reductase, partial [Candidatus Synoicihabitans sp.]|nr:2-dehydropantoate 2-reductase [Candidatus Synoicihabitans sp.]